MFNWLKARDHDVEREVELEAKKALQKEMEDRRKRLDDAIDEAMKGVMMERRGDASTE